MYYQEKTQKKTCTFRKNQKKQKKQKTQKNSEFFRTSSNKFRKYISEIYLKIFFKKWCPFFITDDPENRDQW